MERELGDDTDNELRFLIFWALKEAAAPFRKIAEHRASPGAPSQASARER
jgi:hypothetical protein